MARQPGELRDRIGPRFGFTRFIESITEKVADKIVDRLEVENALPLPEQVYDVVVDDPSMFSKHEYRGIVAISATAAGAEATRRAVRDEGFRVMQNMREGDETTVALGVREWPYYAVVHLSGRHPQIDYSVPLSRAVVVTPPDPEDRVR